MPIHNLERFNKRYWFLKPFFAFHFNKIWYRKTAIINKKNIPENTALLILTNHQNALIDPLTIVFNFKGQTVFLARSDIFKGKFIKSLLYFFKILPVFRIRDGKDNLQHNDYTFQRCVEILRKKKKLCLLPEGNHDKFRRLRPLKKGFARIAFMAEEAENFNLNLKILPVGIDYGSYYNFRSTFLLNIGQAVNLSDFVQDYKENPQKGMLNLMSKMSDELRKLIIDIRSEEYYDTIYESLQIFRFEMARISGEKQLGIYEKFKADKILISCFDDLIEKNPMQMDGYNERVNEYTEKVKTLKIRDWVVNQGPVSAFRIVIKALTMLILLPAHIFGLINNIIPYYIPIYMTRKNKDPQFLSSFRYGISILVFPLFYLLFTLIFFLIVKDIRLTAGFFISLPIAGLFSFQYYIWLKKIAGQIRFRKFKKNQNKEFNELVDLRNSIIQTMKNISSDKLKELV